MSFTLAADELMDGMLKGDHTVIMVSFNLEEAKEKIIYAKKWWESRHPNPSLVPARGEFDEYGNHLGISPYRIDAWPEVVKSNNLELTFSNGFRMLSHPCRPPRGKKASVILDEFAHYQQDGVIYTAAQPMITRGRGRNRIRTASTPLGASGKFWEIHTSLKDFPDFKRYDYGWWEIEDLCTPRQRIECSREYLSGAEPAFLVNRFGTEELKRLYRNVLLEDFLQEYCLQFLDATHAFLTWELIRSCHPEYWKGEEDDEDRAQHLLDTEYREMYAAWTARGVDNCYNAINEFHDAIASGEISGPFAWSYDCGRDVDPAEITVFEICGRNTYKQRLILTLAQERFDDQEGIINHLLSCRRFVRGLIDKGSVGRDIAERLETRWGDVIARSVHYTAELKEMWALTTKLEMERGHVTLIPDRDQDQQLHAIKRRATSSKNMIYEMTESTSSVGGGRKIKHHADKFWAVCMAVWSCADMQATGSFVVPEMPDEFKRVAPTVDDDVSRRGFGRSWKQDRVSASRAASQRVAAKMAVRR